MTQQRCCILGVCCAPFSAEQETALAEYLYDAMLENSSTIAESLDRESGGLRPLCRAAAKKLYADRLIAQAI